MFNFILRKEIVVILIFSFLFVSCSSTFVFSTYDEANKKIGKGTYDVVLTSGQVYDAKEIIVTKDSTYFLDKSSNQLIYIPMKNIRSISDNDHFIGCIEGIALGGSMGYLMGTILDATRNKKGSGFTYALLLAPVGILFGIFYGTLIGHHYYYILPDNCPYPKVHPTPI